MIVGCVREFMMSEQLLKLYRAVGVPVDDIVEGDVELDDSTPGQVTINWARTLRRDDKGDIVLANYDEPAFRGGGYITLAVASEYRETRW